MSPLYDRWCEPCTHLVEDLLEKSTSEEPVECDVCHQMTLTRIPSVGHFQISGFSESNGYSQGGR